MHASTSRIESAGPTTNARAALTALVVDDEPHVRAYLRLILSALGVSEIREAAGGIEGLELYQKYQPSIVLLDVNMPHVSGQETLSRLNEIDPNAVVVVVTSKNEITTVREFQALGASGYVLKHGAREVVTSTIEEILDTLLDDGEES